MMSDVSEHALLDYFYSAGGDSGRVRNADILKTFKPFIGHTDLQLRAKYREEFKLVIDRIAVVKSENGEKYLVLKKKYRQLLHERDTKNHGTDENGQKHANSARAAATAQWEATNVTASSSPQKEQQDELMLCGDTESNAEFESEQDEEGTGSMGSAVVALDPIEKEWIYSAAGARVPDLSQLLRQDPSLANKKDFTSVSSEKIYSICTYLIWKDDVHTIISSVFHADLSGCDRERPFFQGTALHWAAKHGSEDMATLVVKAGADVNTKSGYTPLHIAALHGHRHILDLLIGSYGAKENLRDYSGHLANHYLNIKEPEAPEEECELPELQVTQARERNRNRKLASLFQPKKKWGSAEDLAPIEEERTTSHQLVLPPFRPRKFSR
ncbi:ankyrin repeat domain-containing protein SOWAHA [Solea solea]|uniref:ankyrin repeat domain-containing protein SOWAHA n=1 Tax=Solea solea TaxID=90069 RepID=UPI00272AAABD|nr:ankyrin repeat domain-containing protein SOWAHA [Solea solea]